MDNKEKSPEQELIESIGLMIEKGMESNTNIYTGVVKSVDGKRAVVAVNGQNQNVSIATADVSSGNVVRVFVPEGNMSAAFIIKAEASGGGGGTTTTAYGDLTGKPRINGVTLVDNKTSKELNLYGTDNAPPYPVTSVNGQTGDVTISAGGNVDSVNGKTGVVVLNKSDVGLGNVDNVRQYSTLNPPPYPVRSVDGATGAVVTNAVKTTPQSLSDTQKQQARNNIGAGTSSFNGDYNSLTNKPTIPTKTSQLANDSHYITANEAPVTSVNSKTGTVQLNASDVGALPDTTVIPSKTSQLDNDSGYITDIPIASATQLGGVKVGAGLSVTENGVLSATGGGTADSVEWNNVLDKPTTIAGYGITDAKIENGTITLGNQTITPLTSAPVTSVNSKTGSVVLTQDDVGDGTTYVRTHNDFTDALKTQINTNEDNITMLDGDVEGLQTDVGTLKTNVTNLQTALTSKQDVIVGAASTITENNLTASRALVSNASGKVAVSNVTSTELGYLDGVTGNIQEQLNNKLETAPVTSVDGETGVVVTNAVKTTAQDLSISQKAQARTNIGAGTSNFSGSYDDLSNKPTIPDPYTLPVANSTTLGGVKPVAKTSAMTQSVGVDANGALYTAPGGGGTGSGDMLKSVYDATGTVEQAGGIPDYVANNAPVVSVNGKTGAVKIVKGDVGLGKVRNETQYSAQNPPPYPVTSVNGKTGDVTVSVPTVPSTTNILKGNGSGGIEAATPGTDYADVFIIDCTADGTVDDSMPITLTPSKTYDEVRNAILEQKQCYAQYDGIYYPLAEVFINAAESNNITGAFFTVAKPGIIMRSIRMQHLTLDKDPVWSIQPPESALRAPESAKIGQVMAYRGALRGWRNSAIGTNLSTAFSGLIKGSDGYLAQAEAGTDYMAPVAVTSADNGKFLRVVNGAWAAVSIDNANGGSF